MSGWTVAIEGEADEAVARAILRHCGLDCVRPLIAGGKTKLDPRLPGYLDAARRTPWLILRDLDRDAGCAPELITRLVSGVDAAPLRIAVHSVEAWLLADREAAARWLRVQRSAVPRQVEAVPDAKGALVDLARQSSNRDIRADIVPEQGSTARHGKGYVDQVRAFCSGAWRPDVAARNCDSLRRCIDFVRARAHR